MQFGGAPEAVVAGDSSGYVLSRYKENSGRKSYDRAALSHTQHNDGNLGLERRKLNQQHGKPSRCEAASGKAVVT
ncbi:hypothetical protein PF005_g8171 [Phytophthora fragariae]|uniref:Uncharacterized protein n=1 Tax=Phytophthora fragariae TaxID=53985 RepID=A0A6A3LQ90_9STRA|nr:hypothetical protein PF011_g6291 [Phytophthora fragariae]KAE9218685.1 hypothetical protein PF005_g8171 [Phytophthora fragariae]